MAEEVCFDFSSIISYDKMPRAARTLHTIDKLCSGYMRDFNHVGRTSTTGGLGIINLTCLMLVNWGRIVWS